MTNKLHSNVGSHLLFALVVAMLAQSCGSVSLLTSADQRRGNNDFGYYYLPKKMLSAAVTYKVTYDFYYSLDETHIKQYPKSKRRYSKTTTARLIREIDVSESVPLSFYTVADTDKAYWLSTSNKKGFNSFEINYLDVDNRVIKSINSDFTPSGPGIATSALKTLASITSIIATPGLSASVTEPKDSVAKVVLETTVVKSIDLKQLAQPKLDSLLNQGENDVRVMSFSKKDLNPSDKYKIPEVPTVEVRVASIVTALEQHVGNKLKARANALNGKSDSTSYVKGVVYRIPFICNVRTVVHRKDDYRRFNISSAAKRVSFPQLGVLTVSPYVFSRKFGKQTIALELDTDAGGITKYKVTRENASTEWMTASGDLIKSFGEAYNARPTGSTALDDLKNSNSLLEEKIKQVRFQKTYDSLLLATPK